MKKQKVAAPRAAPKKGKGPDPVGMTFSLERYPAGAWLKVEPDGYCGEAYNAKFYDIRPLPEPVKFTTPKSPRGRKAA